MPTFLSVLCQLALFGLILGLTGCSPPRFIQPSTANLPCAQRWDAMERQLEQQQVLDVASRRVPGFPYLRSNRFYAELAPTLDHPDQQQALLEQLRQLDLAARSGELQRLDPLARHQLLQQWDSADDETLRHQLTDCSARLLHQDRQQDTFYPRLLAALPVEDNYASWQRWVGFYPLFVWPVDALAHNAHQEIRHRLQQFDERSAAITVWTHYQPAGRRQLTQPALSAVLNAARANPLAIYQLSASQLARLAHHYAPQLRLAGDGHNDRFGRVTVEHDQLVVDTAQPTVYYYAGHALLQGVPALQLNYVFWYPGRYADEVSWIERGRFDGVTLRYTLDEQGQLLMVDLINNCGCYHGFLPSADHFELQRLKQPQMAPQVLQPLPNTSSDVTLGFTFNRRHQLVQTVTAPPWPGTAYQLRPYRELEQMATAHGPARSLFDSRGVVPDSRRVESALLFSMGISSVGSMRQRGNQPTTLVGRQHFDDPHLFDELFFYRHPAAAEAPPCDKDGSR